jgi:hypothetical protein
MLFWLSAIVQVLSTCTQPVNIITWWQMKRSRQWEMWNFSASQQFSYTSCITLVFHVCKVTSKECRFTVKEIVFLWHWKFFGCWTVAMLPHTHIYSVTSCRRPDSEWFHQTASWYIKINSWSRRCKSFNNLKTWSCGLHAV